MSVEEKDVIEVTDDTLTRDRVEKYEPIMNKIETYQQLIEYLFLLGQHKKIKIINDFVNEDFKLTAKREINDKKKTDSKSTIIINKKSPEGKILGKEIAYSNLFGLVTRDYENGNQGHGTQYDTNGNILDIQIFGDYAIIKNSNDKIEF